MFPTSFSTVNPRFLQDDLFFSKKSVYMKNAEQRAGFETFCRKSWFFKYSLSKSTKTTPKLCNLLVSASDDVPKSDRWSDFPRAQGRPNRLNGSRGKPPVQGDPPNNEWSRLASSRQAIADINTKISKSILRFPGTRSKVPLRGDNYNYGLRAARQTL